MVKTPPWPPACELNLAARHIYGYCEEARKHGLLPGEESLTDSFVLSLKRRRFPYVSGFRGRLPAGSDIMVRQFNIAQEAHNGADWDLLIDANRQQVHYRIQAKRLYRNGRYTRVKDQQHKRLLDTSRSIGAIPLYALYNGPREGVEIQSACRLAGVPEARLGCTLVAAESRAKGKDKGHSWSNDGVGKTALPLECLVSCHCMPPQSGLSAAWTRARIELAQKRTMLGEDADRTPDEWYFSWMGSDDYEPNPQLNRVIDAWLNGESTGIEDLERNLFPNSRYVILITDRASTA